VIKQNNTGRNVLAVNDHSIIATRSGTPDQRETGYAWMRLGVCVLMATIGSVGMWSVVVALPAVQAEFGVTRAEASLPYTLTTFGFAFGGILMGRLSDRFGIMYPAIGGAIMLAAGFVASSFATNLWQFALIQGVLIGGGSSATFGPLIADISHWFTRRRGIAVSICASGNYFAGAIWPPVVQHLIATSGWRSTHVVIGAICIATMVPLAFALRRKVQAHDDGTEGGSAGGGTLGLPPNLLMGLLALAGVACCVAMAMPQVHIVAYCGDLGYGVARGAEMLSVMLGFGIVSRIGSGWIADRIGGLGTLLLGSVAQAAALTLYLGFDGLTSLYVISALFGLFQGGIVPSYAIIIREYFAPGEAGARVGIVLMASLFGMAFGGWVSGLVFDLTGSYQEAFAIGIAWNFLNIAIVVWLLRRRERPGGRMALA
jgi:MFS family permease